MQSALCSPDVEVEIINGSCFGIAISFTNYNGTCSLAGSGRGIRGLAVSDAMGATPPEDIGPCNTVENGE